MVTLRMAQIEHELGQKQPLDCCALFVELNLVDDRSLNLDVKVLDMQYWSSRICCFENDLIWT